MAMAKIAYVCSGGAAKAGAFHLGVAKALREAGFNFIGGTAPSASARGTPGPRDISIYVGSSAGAIISTFLAAGYSIQSILASFMQNDARNAPAPGDKPLTPLSYKKMFMLRPAIAREQAEPFLSSIRLFSRKHQEQQKIPLQFKWFKATGIFSTGGIEKYLRDDVLTSNDFSDYLADLFIVATDLNYSRKVVFGKSSILPQSTPSCTYSGHATISEACAASTALPFVYAPYTIKSPDGTSVHYVDGEIRDTLSAHVAVDAGAELVIASYTHQPLHTPHGESLAGRGLPAILIQSLYLAFEDKITRAREDREDREAALAEIDGICRKNRVSPKVRDAIRAVFKQKLGLKPGVKTIYIHPDPADEEMFFGEHFSLSAKNLQKIADAGFKAAAARAEDFSQFLQSP
ncbi:MAG: hypothetical protein A2583_08025 [Bdellovibrionales bacterium RIFOXYD1_FULL_53_11]|nr:MAG: hypothetical protein A2583_08025 [Bdellovibrionales bacterium RIFOXYD1_FULL_53_11]